MVEARKMVIRFIGLLTGMLKDTKVVPRKKIFKTTFKRTKKRGIRRGVEMCSGPDLQR